jgi:hypothetical protein
MKFIKTMLKEWKTLNINLKFVRCLELTICSLSQFDSLIGLLVQLQEVNGWLWRRISIWASTFNLSTLLQCFNFGSMY